MLSGRGCHSLKAALLGGGSLILCNQPVVALQGGGFSSLGAAVRFAVLYESDYHIQSLSLLFLPSYLLVIARS